MTENGLNKIEQKVLECAGLFYIGMIPSQIKTVFALARVGLAVAENAKLIDAVLEQADADSYTVEAEFSAGSDEQYEKERAAIAHVRTMLLSALPKPGDE